MQIRIDYLGHPTELREVSPVFLLNEDHIEFKLYDLRTMQSHLHSIIYTENFNIGMFIEFIKQYTNNKEIKVAIFRGEDDLIHDIVHLEFGWEIFSIVKSVGWRNDKVYDQCISMLKFFSSPILTYIRPYMCEFLQNDITAENPLLAMYRYVDINKGVTTFDNGKVVTTDRSSLLELGLPLVQVGQLIYNNILTIGDYYDKGDREACCRV